MRLSRLGRCAIGLLLATACGPAAAVEIGWLASLGATSDFVHRGITQSSGEPAAQAGLSLRVPQGFYAGVWGSTIDTSRLGPDFGDGDGYEFDALLGISQPFNADWNWNFSVGRYNHADNSSILDYDYTEVGIGLGWRERLQFSAAWSPHSTDHTRQNTLLQGPRYVVEAAVEWPLTRWLSATGGYGYNDAAEVSDVRFTYYSGGINLRWRRYALGLTHYGTDRDARQRWADGRAADRFVVNLAATFGGDATLAR